MKFFFKIALFSILLYLILDVTIENEEGGGRSSVQLVAGFSFVLTAMYNIKYFFGLAKYRKMWSFFKIWRFYVLLYFIYFFLYYLELPSSLAVGDFRRAVIAVYIFSVALFIFYGKLNNHLSDRLLNIVLLIIFFNGLIEVYNAYINPKMKEGMEVFNTAAGYIFGMIMPLLLFRFKSRNIWVFVITLILTMFTGKRGALLIYVIVFFYGLFNRRKIAQYIKADWKVVVFFVLIIIGSAYFMSIFADSLFYRLTTLEDENKSTIGSGRDIMWTTLGSFWTASNNYIYLLFGYGLSSTKSIIQNIAHNDLIQNLTDFGLLGLFMYVYLLAKLYMDIQKMKTISHYLYIVLMMAFYVWVGRALVAGIIRTDQIVLSISIGYLFAQATIDRISHAGNKIPDSDRNQIE